MDNIMKQFTLYCLAIFFLLPLASFSQNSGFMGKKNTFSISGTGALRILPFALNESMYYTKFDANNNQFEDKLNLFRWDVNTSYKRLIKRNVAVGLMVNYSQIQTSTSYIPYSVDTYDPDEGYYDFFNIRNSSTSVFNVFKFRPTITFAPKNSLFPMGISHTLGFGPMVFSLNKSKDYRYTFSGDQTIYNYVAPANYSYSLWGVEFLYSTTINYPVSKWLLIEFGYDLTFGAVLPNNASRIKNRSYFDLDTAEGMVNEAFYNNDLHLSFTTRSLVSFLSIRCGLVIPF